MESMQGGEDLRVFMVRSEELASLTEISTDNLIGKLLRPRRT